MCNNFMLFCALDAVKGMVIFMNRQEINLKLENMKAENLKKIQSLTKSARLSDYKNLVKKDGEKEIWTEAFQKSLYENEIVYIQKKSTPYYIDKTVIIPSNRHIEAEDGAIIKQSEGIEFLMLRNENTVDGTRLPVKGAKKDCNISINGGHWEESYTFRKGYRQSGKFDNDESHYYGVSTCILFNNIDGLTLTNMSFCHTAGFSVQTGELTNGVFENIFFSECFADGIHINGNVKNILVRNIRGQVGDDLVALNMYDWQNSSVNFGPGENILCENLELMSGSGYAAMRIEPGIYYFDNGEYVDCSLKNAYIKNVKGIKTFKLYFQTFPYIIGEEEPEKGSAGTIDNVYFENISINLDEPVDKLPEYVNSDPVRGTFAAFELGSKIGRLTFTNIDITLDKEKFPMSYFLAIGPKSVTGTYKGKPAELFDPYISSFAEEIRLENITINGKKSWDTDFAIKEIEFNNVNNDGKSTAKGEIKKLIIK